MELDELRHIWNKNKAEFQVKNETQIASMLKGSSQSIVDKLKRSVWFELIFTFIAGIGLMIYAFTLPSGSLRWISISITFLFVVYAFYYIKKLSVLNRFVTNNADIKTNLRNLVESLTGYLKFYKRSYAILYPFYFCLGLLYTAIERGTHEFLHILSQPNTIIYLIVLAGIFVFCSTWFVSWWLRKLYGNHLEKLKKLLDELEEL